MKRLSTKKIIFFNQNCTKVRDLYLNKRNLLALIG